MARYIGPKTKIARTFGEPIFGSDKYLDKKNYPPGQHGLARKRKKVSEYGMQLREKQKAKAIYGILERQFRRTFEDASRMGGVTGTNLMQILESRLDNVIYRMGLAPSRAAARQLVTHRHITVNGEIVNVPSYRVKEGQIISVRERSKSLEVIVNAVETIRGNRYPWIEWDSNTMSARFLQLPERSEIPENIEEQLIVELYSK